MNEKILDMLIEILAECDCSFDEDCGNFLYELEPSECNVEISTRNIVEWCNSDDPLSAFKSGVELLYAPAADAAVNTILTHLRETWDSEEYPWAVYEDEIVQWLKENLIIEYPFPDLLHQMIPVDIIVDTGDARSNFTTNNVYPYSHGKSYGTATPSAESSVLWLAKEQGYSERQFRRAMHHCDFGGGKLLESIREEILQTPCKSNALCFFVEMTLSRLLVLQVAIKSSNTGSERGIMLDRLSRCGLYDPKSGQCSFLGIELEREVLLPYKYVFSALPNGGRETPAIDVFGVTPSLWQPTVLLYD